MSPLEFRVVLFNPSRVFYPGQAIQGQVLVNLSKHKVRQAIQGQVLVVNLSIHKVWQAIQGQLLVNLSKHKVQ